MMSFHSFRSLNLFILSKEIKRGRKWKTQTEQETKYENYRDKRQPDQMLICGILRRAAPGNAWCINVVLPSTRICFWAFNISKIHFNSIENNTMILRMNDSVREYTGRNWIMRSLEPYRYAFATCNMHDFSISKESEWISVQLTSVATSCVNKCTASVCGLSDFNA